MIALQSYWDYSGLIFTILLPGWMGCYSGQMGMKGWALEKQMVQL
jgi:hypothetical protein